MTLETQLEVALMPCRESDIGDHHLQTNTSEESMTSVIHTQSELQKVTQNKTSVLVPVYVTDTKTPGLVGTGVGPPDHGLPIR